MSSNRTISTPPPPPPPPPIIDDEDEESMDTSSTPTSSSSSSSSVRLMAAGNCKAELKSGNIGLDCPCPRGIFPLSHTNDISDKCVECEHSIAEHEGTDNERKVVEEPPTPRHTTLTKLMNLMDLNPLLYVRGIRDTGKGTVKQFRRDNIMLMTREQEAHSFFLPVDKPLEEFDSEEDLLTQFVNSFHRLCEHPQFFFLVLYTLTLSAFLGDRFVKQVILPCLPVPGR
ncbi:hypothetical protein AbraIFM66951_000105 [Aspergillus brasiliensis]|nr:hypothetical protein AbraIFM66951_000105 [Aspergillus brasiliensis]